MEIDRYPESRFGEARRTVGRHGYVAYFPRPIPRALDLSPAVIRLLSDAEAALGRLAGVGQLLPNPHLLIHPYALREALSSTRIEGTRSSFAELYELQASGAEPDPDAEEVINYVAALEHGLTRLATLPLSVRLLREMHGLLMQGVRGRERRPGELRTSQNLIGGTGSTIDTASFVPPPPDELAAALRDWEQFANEDSPLPLLVQDALLHYQFETLHPFLDGNGRLGRLLIVLFLVARGRLPAPLLYLSSYLDQHRRRYYEALEAPRRSGDIEPWLTLFLEAVESQALDAVGRAERFIALRDAHRTIAAGLGSAKAVALVDVVFEEPILVTRTVEQRLGVTRPTAISLLRQLRDVGILTQDAAGPRGQLRFVAKGVMDVLAGDELAPEDLMGHHTIPRLSLDQLRAEGDEFFGTEDRLDERPGQ